MPSTLVIETDKAEQGEHLQLSPPLAPSVDHVGSKALPRGWSITAAIWGILLFIFVIVAKTNLTDIVEDVIKTVLAALGSVATIISLFRKPPWPVNPKVTRVAVRVILVMELFLTGWLFQAGLGVLSFRQANTIDMLSTVTLDHAINIPPDGHATLVIDVPEQRDALALVLKVDDHIPDIGSCLPSTLLLVTPYTGGNRGKTVSGGSGDQMLVDLPAGTPKVHLDIAVRNHRGDQNCHVDLSAVRATLQNH